MGIHYEPDGKRKMSEAADTYLEHAKGLAPEPVLSHGDGKRRGTALGDVVAYSSL